ncbi:hypothetical protein TWF730_002347 [Orbilia blumenaviensis]|uniref:F-box domain-containing protein n=1 Tax=Orbilia blumenaviensis TaxID=1796055 RepID=A0AAV9UBA4_9PEZI
MSHPDQIILPDLPLEVQCLILESSDWLQQSILRQVCKAWQNYIDTSDTLLDDCYKSTVPCTDATDTTIQLFSPTPQFHNVVNYRSGFVRSSRSPTPSSCASPSSPSSPPSAPAEFTPCIFHKNAAGEVVDYSPEADLTIYLSDPLLKPGSELYIDGMDVYVKGDDDNSYTTTLSSCDHGSVASYLRDTCEAVEGVGRRIEGKFLKVELALGKTTGGDIRLNLFVEAEREAPMDERAGSLIGQLSIS